jgi:hypothetical protein
MINEEVIDKKCIEVWGESEQIRQTIEECAELIVKLAKWKREVNGSTPIEICNEIADVEIMCKQMRLIFDFDDKVDKFKEIKLLGLEARLKEAQNG